MDPRAVPSRHPNIHAEGDGDVTTVTIDRPRSKNARQANGGGDGVSGLAQCVKVHTEDLGEALRADVERRPPTLLGR